MDINSTLKKKKEYSLIVNAVKIVELMFLQINTQAYIKEIQ